MSVVIETERLILRHWKNKDVTPFIEMCADRKVMEFLSAPLTPMEAQITVKRIHSHFKKHGFGLYAIEQKESKKFIGFTGFMIPNFEHFFTPCVEIGWRIKSTEWKKGFATEAAAACLKFGFSKLGFKKIHSFTSIHNLASERVMQKIGLLRKGTFFHPMLPSGHLLSEHVLYCTE
ncbi:MAG TPA: GNAT family N-acetyltransferase [Puia sp.]|jgi:RimJ/RimL family protein N-acetyltransferase|nr:GNAT family N-acetyltransferase [Puia sp.]